MKNLTTKELENKLSEAQKQITTINGQLNNSELPDETYRALVKSKNETLVTLQEINTELAVRAETYPKTFNRSLNESFEL